MVLGSKITAELFAYADDIHGSEAAFEEGHQGAEGTPEEGVGADHQLSRKNKPQKRQAARSPAEEEQHQKHVEMFDKSFK
jgi:hypothetical protein